MDHAMIGGGRLLPCMFSRVLTVPVRALGLRVHVCVVWRDGTPPRWAGLAILVSYYSGCFTHFYVLGLATGTDRAEE